jgi:hypothetical protein
MMMCEADVATTTAATVSVLGAAAAPITEHLLVFIGAAGVPVAMLSRIVTKYKLARNLASGRHFAH